MDWTSRNTNSVVSGAGGFIAASLSNRIDRKWTAYQNRLVNLAAAQSRNALVDNKAMAQEEHLSNVMMINKSRLEAEAQAKAGAAAAGVAGGSVDTTIFETGRNAGAALNKEQSQFEQQLHVMEQQRDNVEAQRVARQRQLPQRPSALGAILGITADILDPPDVQQSSGTADILDPPDVQQSSRTLKTQGFRL